MASSSRSFLVDYTYEQISSLLSGQREGTHPEQIETILEAQLEKLTRNSEPYKKPSDASKQVIESGSVELPDGVVLKVEEVEKEVVSAICGRFQIDQVDALVLLRSFIYNEGLPQTPDAEATQSLAEEVVTAITSFYYSERIHVTRVLIALLRTRQEKGDPLNAVATNILSKAIPDPVRFTTNLLSEYTRKINLSIPETESNDPRASSQWAKQNAKEQLVLLELLFWMMWDYVPCSATLIVSIFEAAYGTDFGHRQENATSMLDSEGTQVVEDIAALWIIITVEILNLESVLQTGLEFSNAASETSLLSHSGPALEKVHKLVMSNTTLGYVCTLLAWAFYLKSISDAANRLAEKPPQYAAILDEIRSSAAVIHRKGEKELHAALVVACLRPDSGLFTTLLALLTKSPLFVTASAWKSGSSVTDPGAIAYRSVLKGLIISLVEYEPVELIPDFEGLVEVWIALFGFSASVGVATLCKQYWDCDFRQSKARRAIIDVARSRFPVQFRPLVRLMRAMTGAGFTEPLDGDSTSISPTAEREGADADYRACSTYVFHYFRHLSTYTQVITASARTGATSPFDRIIDRPSPTSPASSGTAYTNLRPVALPGGSILPQKTVGRLLCSDSSTDPVVVAWQHEHNGWMLIVEVLLEYINRRHSSARSTRSRADVAASRRGDHTVTLRLDEVGLDLEEEELIVADSLDLIYSIIQKNPTQAQALMASLESGGTPVSFVSKDSPPPDLVQLIFMVLEDALSRAQSSKVAPPSVLITPALGVLSSILSLPTYSNRIWLYLRSTAVLFGPDLDANFTSAILSAERAAGQYPMSLSLLRLVRSLFEEAFGSLVLTHSQQPRLQLAKDEVLARAVQFIHSQIWVEHAGWRYARLGDRFEIGRQIVATFARVLESITVMRSANAFSGLTTFVTNTFVLQATNSTNAPVVQTIASGRSLLTTLTKLRRLVEARQYARLLEASLQLTRLVLTLKFSSPFSTKLSVLEQVLCADVSISGMSVRAQAARVNPVDILATYVKSRELGVKIPLEAIRVLSALCLSLSACTPAPPSIIGHFTDAQATMTAMVKILRHPFDDLALRNAIWAFIAIAVEKQPPIAVLFVSGQFFRVQSAKGKGVKKDVHEADTLSSNNRADSAVDAACEALETWKELWEHNPQLLATVLTFLDVVWQGSLDHITGLDSARTNKDFWDSLAGLAKEELGPSPDYAASHRVESENGYRSDLHDAVSMHAYRTKAKSHALRILGADIAMHVRSTKSKEAVTQPDSYKVIAPLFSGEDLFMDSIAEGISSSYDPTLHDGVVELVKSDYAPLTAEGFRTLVPTHEREFGDSFLLSIALLRDVIRGIDSVPEKAAEATTLILRVASVNLNLSLVHAQLLLVDAWRILLEQVRGFLRGQANLRGILLTVSASVARDIASERREGDLMFTVHGSRLRLLLGLLEVAWFSPSGKDKEPESHVRNFMMLMEHLGGIIVSQTFPPGKSFLGGVSDLFHRPLLQIVYFCARNSQLLNRDSSSLKANQRLVMNKTLTSGLILVIDALRLTFDTARSRLDPELDKDAELLVAVFQQCTRPGLHTSSLAWLTRLQEADVIASSLRLLAHVDIAGFSDVDLLRAHGQPLYAPHVLLFHTALASTAFTAERLASEGFIATYSNNSLSPAVIAGAVSPTLPELLPGERNPAHRAYCAMLANVAGTFARLGNPAPAVFSQQVAGFVQLYGTQVSNALGWTNDDPLTLPFLDELALTLELFYLLAENLPTSRSEKASDHALSPILEVYTERALLLLQQLNYALTHPKHLMGLLEPITAEDRLQIERETANDSVTSLTELLDPIKRPFLVRVVRRLLNITAKVLSTLNVVSGAEMVLLSDAEEWPTRQALVVPHSKVTMGEPASIGTLLELGNFAFEILRFLVNQPSSIQRSGPDQASKALVTSIQAARQILESVLLYTSTQLVMWLSKHDIEGTPAGDMEMDEASQSDNYLGFSLGGHRADGAGANDNERDRRLKRKSMTLADRLRRGMTGEMTMDLQALITRAKPTIARSTEVLGVELVDLTPILATFVEERVNTS